MFLIGLTGVSPIRLELLPYYVIRKRRAKNFSRRKKPLINTRPARDRKKERKKDREIYVPSYVYRKRNDSLFASAGISFRKCILLYENVNKRFLASERSRSRRNGEMENGHRAVVYSDDISIRYFETHRRVSRKDAN